VAWLAPVRARYAELIADPGHLDDVLAAGGATATARAEDTMALVRERVGLLGRASRS
jgi:tryptophanyl-tRNA synthetase